MKLLILLVCLIAFQYLHVPRAKLTRWFGAYVHLWINLLGKQNWFNSLGGVFLLAIVPVIAFSFSVKVPFLPLALAIVIVLFCLSVTHELSPAFINPHGNAPSMQHVDYQAIPSALWQFNYYFITPLFWFLILDVFGILFYTCFLYASFCPSMPRWQATAGRVVEMAAWIPSRITAIGYAFAGNLKPCLKVWSELLMTDSQSNHVFLLSCAQAAHQAKPELTPAITYLKLLRDAQILLLGLFAAFAMLFMIF